MSAAVQNAAPPPLDRMLPLDSDSRGPRLFNVSARVDSGGRIRLGGVYDASDLVPLLLFSVGVPWVEPCRLHVCCLWEVLARYKDHALTDALGPTCDERVNLTAKDLMKGNPSKSGRWEVTTMIHPSFVAMLFLCLVGGCFPRFLVRGACADAAGCRVRCFACTTRSSRWSGRRGRCAGARRGTASPATRCASRTGECCASTAPTRSRPARTLSSPPTGSRRFSAGGSARRGSWDPGAA
jgi:hypothetical protein